MTSDEQMNTKASDVLAPSLDTASHVKTQHNTRLYTEVFSLKSRINDLVSYQLAHPKIPNPSTRDEIDSEKRIQREIATQEKYVRSQLSLVKTLYRQSVLKVREEKAETGEGRAINDKLILGLSNLKYEEQSLRSEIAAAENYDHKYTKLPLISAEEFLAKFPQHADASDHDLMIVRIEHEHQDRVKLEERRQEKLKQKQKLIAEVKKGKDDLTKLDSMVEKFVEAAEPIRKVLATDE